MGPIEVLWNRDGVPFQGVDKEIPVKTVPSRRTTYASGKNHGALSDNYLDELTIVSC